MDSTALAPPNAPIPCQFQEIVDEAKAAWEARDFSVRRTLSGKSGDYVALVEIRTKKYDGVGIFKASIMDSSGDEYQRQAQALSLDGLLPTKHIPRVSDHFEAPAGSAMLMEIASNSIYQIDPLANVDSSRRTSSYRKVSDALLRDWNISPSFENKNYSPSQVLQAWLEHRLFPEQRLFETLRRFGISPDALSFSYDGVDYPNPYFLATNNSDSTFNITPAYGALHGDLNVYNVLIPLIGSQNEYFIIDFSHFQAARPLLFDHAYLELSFLLLCRESATPQRWHRLCDDLSSGVAQEVDDAGAVEIASILRSSIQSWIAKHFPARTDDLTKQAHLARIAAGLNFASKRALAPSDTLSEKLRFFAIIYAAKAAKDLFSYCNAAIPHDGPIARLAEERALPGTDAWRDVWNACEEFNAREAVFILVAGPEVGTLAPHLQETLGRLPWSIVIDLDGKGLDSPFSKHGSRYLKNHGLHKLLPHQTPPQDVRLAPVWLFANTPAPGASATTGGRWRRSTLSSVRTLGENLRGAAVPSPIYAIILSGDEAADKVRDIARSLDEAMGGDLNIVVVTTPGLSNNVIGQDIQHRDFVCDWRDFALGAYQSLGDPGDAQRVWIPTRDQGTRIVRPDLIDEDAAAVFAATVDIVPQEAEPPAQDVSAEVSDFLRGNTITWWELNLDVDVRRDVTDKILGDIRRLLSSAAPMDTYCIAHSPGAGGSTIARRAAWDLRHENPTVIIKRLSTDTIDAIDAIFRQSGLPVLLVAEAPIMAGPQREYFINQLKSRTIRFVLVEVQRTDEPRDGKGTAAITDPMSPGDTKRFLGKYEPLADASRRAGLQALATRDTLKPYRSPFFFGLYAFESDFVRIEQHVQDLLEGASERTRIALAQLALITAYSQQWLPRPVFWRLLGLKDQRLTLAAAVGKSLSSLITFNGAAVKISHPLLATQVLRQCLQPLGSRDAGSWRTGLSSFCIALIDEMASDDLRDSNFGLELLTDLFIDRQPWEDSSANAKPFSNLILAIQSDAGERRVLETLTKRFPQEAHFFNHLGRHLNIRGTGSFLEAEANLLRAIELEPKTAAHRHTLGMIYRTEVRRQMDKRLLSGESTDSRLQHIRPTVDRAMAAFSEARRLQRDSQYPLVTPIQMILETVERFQKLTGQKYRALFAGGSDVASWCRDQVTEAQDLLSELHHLEANSQPTQRRIECDSRMSGVLGDFRAMVDGLSNLLKRPGVNRPPIRRMISRAYLRRPQLTDGTRLEEECRTITTLMEANLADDPSNAHDVQTWFRAFRMLPEFSVTRALDQMGQWEAIGQEVDSAFYLFILHFMSIAIDQNAAGVERCKYYIDLCKSRAPALISKVSFEWFGSENLNRPCPLLHHSELGPWSRERNFFEKDADPLLRVLTGRIDDIRSAQFGTIDLHGIPAFFPPGAQFHRGTDLNKVVSCNIGFSYEGLRAWNVRRIDSA